MPQKTGIQAFLTQPYFDEPFFIGYNIGGYELGPQPQEGEIPISPDINLEYN